MERRVLVSHHVSPASNYIFTIYLPYADYNSYCRCSHVLSHFLYLDFLITSLSLTYLMGTSVSNDDPIPMILMTKQPSRPPIQAPVLTLSTVPIASVTQTRLSYRTLLRPAPSNKSTNGKRKFSDFFLIGLVSPLSKS